MHNPIAKPIEVLLVEDNTGDVRLTKEAFKEGRVRLNLSVARDRRRSDGFSPQRGDVRQYTSPGSRIARSQLAEKGRSRGPQGNEKRSPAVENPRGGPNDFGLRRRYFGHLRPSRQLLYH